MCSAKVIVVKLPELIFFSFCTGVVKFQQTTSHYSQNKNALLEKPKGSTI